MTRNVLILTTLAFIAAVGCKSIGRRHAVNASEVLAESPQSAVSAKITNIIELIVSE